MVCMLREKLECGHSVTPIFPTFQVEKFEVPKKSSYICVIVHFVVAVKTLVRAMKDEMSSSRLVCFCGNWCKRRCSCNRGRKEAINAQKETGWDNSVHHTLQRTWVQLGLSVRES